MKKPKRPITPDIEIEDLVSDYPELIPILTAQGIICIHCGAPIWGTLVEVVEKMNLNPDEIVAELNRRLKTPVGLKKS